MSHHSHTTYIPITEEISSIWNFYPHIMEMKKDKKKKCCKNYKKEKRCKKCPMNS